MIDTKGSEFEPEIMRWSRRRDMAYPIDYRWFEERGVEVDHSCRNRSVLKYTPELENGFRQPVQPAPKCAVFWRESHAPRT